MCTGKVDDSNSQISSGMDVTDGNDFESNSSNAPTAAAWRKQLVAVTDDHNFRVLSLNKVCYAILYVMLCYIIVNIYDCARCSWS
jgi:hypothetical protein